MQWDPSTRHLPPEVLDGVDAVVNVAGVSLGARRFTPAFKAEVIRSRTDGTTALADGDRRDGTTDPPPQRVGRRLLR